VSKIVFLQRLWYEYNGVSSLSAVLKENGHQVNLLIGNKISDFVKRLDDADVVAFSVMTGLHHWVLDILSEIKKKRKIISILGGPHPTYFPEIINHPSVDIICRGEGEYALLDMMNCLDAHDDFRYIPNLWVKRNGQIYKNNLRPLVLDLDRLPFTDRDIYYQYADLRGAQLKPFSASRGCPFECAFCFNDKFVKIYGAEGSSVRLRNPENLIEEIDRVRAKYGLSTIFFTDDVLGMNQRWFKNLLTLMAERVSLPFICNIRADLLNEEIAVLLKSAGCHSVSFGIESGNERIRKEILKKNLSNQQIIDAARVLKKYSIKFITFNILGIPGETLENAYETVDLNIQIKTDYPKCTMLVPYPMTAISEYAKARGLLLSEPEQILGSSQHLGISKRDGFLIKNEEIKRLINLHHLFQTTVVSPCLYPLIKKLISLPPNILFKAWWGIVYFFIYVTGERRSLWQSLRLAFHNMRVFID